MIKRTLYFGNPYSLKTSLDQLIVESKGAEEQFEKSIPIEDVGFVVIDHPQIRFTVPAIQKLTDNNVAIIWCDEKHHPSSILHRMHAHHKANQHARAQLKASKPLRKQLWKTTIKAKIRNQRIALERQDVNIAPLKRWRKNVRTGDHTHMEGKAAKYYWSKFFSKITDDFVRHRTGPPPNHLLNYGYAIIRAAVARSLAGNGMIPLIGIHHHNKYSGYPLADDVMEPFRPFVDLSVLHLVKKNEALLESTDIVPEVKKKLLSLLGSDSSWKKQMSPLMLSIHRSCRRLVKSFMKEDNHLLYPSIPDHYAT